MSLFFILCCLSMLQLELIVVHDKIGCVLLLCFQYNFFVELTTFHICCSSTSTYQYTGHRTTNAKKLLTCLLHLRAPFTQPRKYFIVYIFHFFFWKWKMKIKILDFNSLWSCSTAFWFALQYNSLRINLKIYFLYRQQHVKDEIDAVGKKKTYACAHFFCLKKY